MHEVGAVIFTGVLAAAIAVWGIISQRSIARRRATFDHIARTEADNDFIQARLMFIKLAKAKGGLAPWAEADREKSKEADAIRLVLNDYELIAIGIQRGIIHFTFFARWHRSSTIYIWNHASPFVDVLRRRTQNPAFFHEFEEMARWMRGEAMPRRTWWWGRFF